ncbi:SseB family protein [Dactylosporangium sp. CS-033363]|uniref:SseB family protein n=1 Tax=Dactylosporangium sp. CS-033363 TaxID=3239935 RepID=UPI003D924D0B
MFDRPGFSRTEIESPEADEPPASKPFGDVSAGARSAGFGRADLDEHPFFADEGPAPARGLFEPQEPSAWSSQQPVAEPPVAQPTSPAPEAWDAPRPESAAPSWQEVHPESAAPSWQVERQESRPESAGSWQESRPESAAPSWQEERQGERQGERQEPQPESAAPSWQEERQEERPDERPESPARNEERSEPAPWEESSAPSWQEREEKPATEETGGFFSGRAEVQQSPYFQAPAPEPQRSFFGEQPAPREEEQRPFFDDEPEQQPFSAFGTQRADDAPVRDPYAALADLRSEPEKEPEQVSFEDGVAALAEHPPASVNEDRAEPSPELRSFFEDDARPDFSQELNLPIEDEEPSSSTTQGFRPSMEDALPSTGQGYQTSGATPEPVYEPEIVDDVPVRLHDEIVDAEVVPPPPAPAPEPVTKTVVKEDQPEFHPANQVERDLFEAVTANSTDRFLSTLLLAKVLIPFWTDGGPVEPMNMRTEHMNGLPHLVVFTSQERMAERLGEDARGNFIKFTRLIRQWPPGDQLAFAINPESPSGAVLPGTEVIQLASWATEMGLGVDDPDEQPAAVTPEPAPQAAPRPAYEPPGSGLEQVMQKPISPEQLSYYLERNYDRVSGFVHRAGEVAHLETPEQLYNALGLGYAGSSFKPDADEAYVLRWIAYRGDLYRIPYGGGSPEAMRAMEGWVIERPPFRGNGFAPSETSDVIAEFKVDSARLPHNAELWRLRRDGRQELIARLDADGPAWRKAGS